MKKKSPKSTPEPSDQTPRPPGRSKGQRVVGLDAHPDILSAVILEVGANALESRRLSEHRDFAIDQLEAWVESNLQLEDLIALEAGANSFEIVARLTKLGFTAVVLESQQVGKLASSYFDDDVAAAERIARAYLTGLAKVVWTPDDLTRQRRELLHAYRRAKTDETRAVNELKGYLNQHNIRVKKRNVRLTHTRLDSPSRRMVAITPAAAGELFRATESDLRAPPRALPPDLRRGFW